MPASPEPMLCGAGRGKRCWGPYGRLGRGEGQGMSCTGGGAQFPKETPTLQGTAGVGCHLQQFLTASEEGVALGSLLQLPASLLGFCIQGGPGLLHLRQLLS